MSSQSQAGTQIFPAPQKQHLSSAQIVHHRRPEDYAKQIEQLIVSVNRSGEQGSVATEKLSQLTELINEYQRNYPPRS